MLRANSKSKGRLIVFEGADESGKTTVSKRLAAELVSRGRKCLWLSFPGREPDTLGAEIYALHHDRRFAGSSSLSIQLLHIAVHVEVIQQSILPAIAGGACVILDRYWWSTWVYGLATNVDPDALRLALKIEQLQWGKQIPSLVFLFERKIPGRKPQPKKRMHLQQLYAQLARREAQGHPVEVIQNDYDIEDAVAQVISSTEKYL
jgi:thymidylate kinase